MIIFGFFLFAFGLMIAWAGFKQVYWIDLLKSLFAEPSNAPKTTTPKGP